MAECCLRGETASAGAGSTGWGTGVTSWSWKHSLLQVLNGAAAQDEPAGASAAEGSSRKAPPGPTTLT